MIDGSHQLVGRCGEERIDLQRDLRAVFSHRPLVAPPDARKGKVRTLVLPRSPNQCQLAGFTSPLGSRNDVAGTRQRRSSNEPHQNLLSRILSSRTLVTRLGARLFWSSTKPQLIKKSSRSAGTAIFPGHVAAVVRQSADGEREIALCCSRTAAHQDADPIT